MTFSRVHNTVAPNGSTAHGINLNSLHVDALTCRVRHLGLRWSVTYLGWYLQPDLPKSLVGISKLCPRLIYCMSHRAQA